MRIKRFAIRLVILLLFIGFALFFLMGRQIDQLKKQDFASVHAANLPDGTYRGKASAILVTAQVEVTLSGGRILQVKLLGHNHGPGYSGEAICDDIVKANSPDVDSVSGATLSSVVIKSAVLEALKSGVSP